MREDINIWIPSNRLELAEECKKSLLPYKAEIYDGTGYESFSKLANECITKSTHETIIISTDKARATSEDVDRLLKLLDEGYGTVGLYWYGFFGFKKDLIRKIGFFDERFLKGGYEDGDFNNRLQEANIACYSNREIEYVKMKTSWGYMKDDYSDYIQDYPGRIHFFNKWNGSIRMIEEEKYLYNIGDYQGSVFLDFYKSIKK